MKCEYIHETAIKDIVDLIKDYTGKGIFNSKTSFKSVASASSNLTLVFPVLTSNTIAIENSSMVSKAIERKAVGMLQMLFSAISITDAKDAIEYVGRFHNNIEFDNELSIDQFIDAVDDYAAQQEAAGMSIIADKALYESCKADLRNINYYLPEAISEASLNSFKINPGEVGERHVVYEARDAVDNAQVLRYSADYRDKQVIDSDVKKANELVPTTMLINFLATDGSKSIGNVIAVIGIKAKLYPIDSQDIINRLASKNKDRQGFFNFIRATTREISFWKDFVFALDKAKIDAINQAGKGSSSKAWKILERRAMLSKLNRWGGMSNNASAISTLVVSKQEVEALKKEYKLDIEKPSIIRPIMESFNLMGVVIVDEAMETAKFIFDTGNDIYETLSFTHLERESSDNSYKKVVNLLTKVNR